MADEVRHQEHGQFKEKLENLEDLKFKVDEIDGTVSLHSSRIQTLEEWRDGIGKQRGAESRLQDVEANVEVVMRIADSKLEKSINGIMDARERTILAYIKAFAPLISGLAAIALAILAVVGVRL